MLRNTKDTEGLDRLGRLVLRSAALDDAESQSFADAPFLYTRIRARIAEEKAVEMKAGVGFRSF